MSFLLLYTKENSQENSPKNQELCSYNDVEFSGSFPDYTIFICKFKIDEPFEFMFSLQVGDI